MSWLIQSLMEGPLLLSDLGIQFQRGQIRDLDIIGRENAEKSNDIKIAMAKGWIKELKKDASSSASSSEVVEGLQKATRAAEQATETAEAQAGLIERLEGANQRLEQQLADYQSRSELKSDRILEEVRAFAEKDPVQLKALKEALDGILVERALVSKGESKSPETSETEINAHERILKLKDEKLRKNFEDIGKTISKEADDVQDALDAMDELGF